jgi:mannosyl-3-phosphoglycerate phosphatase
MNILVFTALDDALLDRDSYSYDAATAGLERIRHQKIPLIFTTSKTRMEIERLQSEMQIREPFITESGAAIYFPDGYRNLRIDAGFHSPPYTRIHLGVTCSEIRRFVFSVKERFGIKGFGNLRHDEIEFLTGLSPEYALLAKQREFTEPFLIEDKKKIDEMAPVAASRGLKITSGERFFNLSGIRQDKGSAVRLCAQILTRNTDGTVVTIGLGDSADDISMLKHVDIPILLPRFDGSYAHTDIINLIKADLPGSRGWNGAILSVLSRLEKSETAG